MPIILVNKLALDFRLRRSARVKRLQLAFRQQTFEVVAPPRITNQAILLFVWQKRQWMARVYARSQQQQASEPIAFFDQNKLLYRGKMWPLVINHGTSFEITLNEHTITCALPYQNKKPLQYWLLNWLKAQTHEIIQSMIAEICPMIGRWPQKVLLKQQKTRWGSCGINDTININWFLIFAPSGVLEYVIVHELAHLIHRNHGIRFWQKVAKCFPGYEAQRIWLRKHGDSLMNIDIELRAPLKVD